MEIISDFFIHRKEIFNCVIGVSSSSSNDFRDVSRAQKLVTPKSLLLPSAVGSQYSLFGFSLPINKQKKIIKQ
ncbi:hypothetical protein BpHYR1_001211 [Brachionus plicatilis]|uniref:Uncharacterized protein n=1 Tax=Brachionus plicatilis TaxID=10195 RepID=A0A3M7T1B4_BRAPC|nr:hypothetical protein BpHYR1_001211 [Brachionus plicatilis]